jgi:hypothetical protein
MAFDKSAFFAALKPKTIDEPLDGFGIVRMSQLSVTEIDSIRSACSSDDAKKELGLRIIISTVVDGDTGARVFSDDDIEQFRVSSNEAVEALATKALKFNNLLKDEAAPN